MSFRRSSKANYWRSHSFDRFQPPYQLGLTGQFDSIMGRTSLHSPIKTQPGLISGRTASDLPSSPPPLKSKGQGSGDRASDERGWTAPPASWRTGWWVEAQTRFPAASALRAPLSCFRIGAIKLHFQSRHVGAASETCGISMSLSTWLKADIDLPRRGRGHDNNSERTLKWIESLGPQTKGDCHDEWRQRFCRGQRGRLQISNRHGRLAKHGTPPMALARKCTGDAQQRTPHGSSARSPEGIWPAPRQAGPPSWERPIRHSPGPRASLPLPWKRPVSPTSGESPFDGLRRRGGVGPKTAPWLRPMAHETQGAASEIGLAPSVRPRVGGMRDSAMAGAKTLCDQD